MQNINQSTAIVAVSSSSSSSSTSLTTSQSNAEHNTAQPTVLIHHNQTAEVVDQI